MNRAGCRWGTPHRIGARAWHGRREDPDQRHVAHGENQDRHRCRWSGQRLPAEHRLWREKLLTVPVKYC
jgi:hypothetical protein